MSDIIKNCPTCGAGFSARELVYSESIRPIGMCLDGEDSSFNFYYFNHEVPGCGTTFVVNVERLLSLIREEIPAAALAGGPGCEGHCLNLADTGPCGAECRFAPFRRLLQIMLEVRGLTGRNLSPR